MYKKNEVIDQIAQLQIILKKSYLEKAESLKRIFINERLFLDNIDFNFICQETAYDKNRAAINPSKENKTEFENNYSRDLMMSFASLLKNLSTKPLPRKQIIWGEAGMGKSTLCAKIVYCWCKNAFLEEPSTFKLIIWISLQELAYFLELQPSCKDSSIHRIIASYLIYNINKNLTVGGQTLNIDDLEFTLHLHVDKILYLLDGLNEIAELPASHLCHRVLNEYLYRLPNQCITSRYHYGVPNLSSYNQVELRRLNNNEIHKYAKKCLANPVLQIKNDKTKKTINPFKIFEQLQKNAALRDIMQVPMHLEMLCSLIKRMENADKIHYYTLTDILSAAIRFLIKQSFVECHLHLNRSKEELSCLSENKIWQQAKEIGLLECLGKLSFDGMVNGNKFFDKKEVTDAITKAIVLKSDKSKKRLMVESIYIILASCKFFQISNIGKENDNLKFIHSIFQEYFAAYYISELIEENSQIKIENKTIKRFIENNKFNPHYQQVWPFLIGLQEELHSYDEVWQIFISSPYDLTGLHTLRVIMDCLGQTHTNKWKEYHLKLVAMIKTITLQVSFKDKIFWSALQRNYLLAEEVSHYLIKKMHKDKSKRNDIIKILSLLPAVESKKMVSIIPKIMACDKVNLKYWDPNQIIDFLNEVKAKENQINIKVLHYFNQSADQILSKNQETLIEYLKKLVDKSYKIPNNWNIRLLAASILSKLSKGDSKYIVKIVMTDAVANYKNFRSYYATDIFKNIPSASFHLITSQIDELASALKQVYIFSCNNIADICCNLSIAENKIINVLLEKLRDIKYGTSVSNQFHALGKMGIINEARQHEILLFLKEMWNKIEGRSGISLAWGELMPNDNEVFSMLIKEALNKNVHWRCRDAAICSLGKMIISYPHLLKEAKVVDCFVSALDDEFEIGNSVILSLVNISITNLPDKLLSRCIHKFLHSKFLNSFSYDLIFYISLTKFLLKLKTSDINKDILQHAMKHMSNYEYALEILPLIKNHYLSTEKVIKHLFETFENNLNALIHACKAALKVMTFSKSFVVLLSLIQNKVVITDEACAKLVKIILDTVFVEQLVIINKMKNDVNIIEIVIDNNNRIYIENSKLVAAMLNIFNDKFHFYPLYKEGNMNLRIYYIYTGQLYKELSKITNLFKTNSIKIPNL